MHLQSEKFLLTDMLAFPQEAAKAATGLEEAQCQLSQHGAAVEEARKLQAAASAALVSLGLRCEGLAETLTAGRGALQVRLLAEPLPKVRHLPMSWRASCFSEHSIDEVC